MRRPQVGRSETWSVRAGGEHDKSRDVFSSENRSNGRRHRGEEHDPEQTVDGHWKLLLSLNFKVIFFGRDFFITTFITFPLPCVVSLGQRFQ